MHTRRRFMQDVAAVAGSAGLLGGPGAPIERALAIEPEKGSTFLDAEHVVILMQENRSFDHAFGALRGVRGFNDPRAIRLPDGNPVWVQSNEKGQKYVPFRLDIKDTKATWTGSLPHSWPDQVDAANGGKHDRWLRVKGSDNRDLAALPLTLGYHTRADLPFYYALADAFTICDQHFCSTLTGTTPNRLHLWTGTVREKPTAESPALVRNEDCDYGRWAQWTTFPERLEDRGISWKIYQNELSLPSGLSDDGDAWLANFTDNPIEWFAQFHVRFAATHRAYRDKMIKTLPGEIESLSNDLAAQTGEVADKLRKRITELKATLATYEKERVEFSAEKFEKLSPRDKSLHARAFCTNAGDPSYRDLAEITYRDGANTQRVKVPKGDILYQFRKDVEGGALPTVSWLVPPERFSDHPSSAWYGQWYLSEVLDILTKKPKVWQKTIFILTYDENDGYFDHVPPFQAPRPKRPETGRTSKALDTTLEYVGWEQDRKHHPTGEVRGNALGLGFRVPMIVASPWSRGGYVCSQVFDHTSVLQLLEKVLTHRTGRKVEEPNITAWRRCICGDLTSAFRPAADDKAGLSGFLARDPFIETIHRAQFRKLPDGPEPLSAKEIDQIRKMPQDSRLPSQEPGVRRACALPYQLLVDGGLNKERTHFAIRLEAKNELFADRAAGAPFIAYAFTGKEVVVRHYTVAAGESVEDNWPLTVFDGGKYHCAVYGPNGLFREFLGDGNDPVLDLRLDYERASARAPALTGRVEILLTAGEGVRNKKLMIRDNAYGNKEAQSVLAGDTSQRLAIETARSFGWYDLGIALTDFPRFSRRYAGRVETGNPGISDPAMGRAGMNPSAPK
jgi:phospholipase C